MEEHAHPGLIASRACAGSPLATLYFQARCMPTPLFKKGHDPRRNTKGRGKGKIGIPDLLRRIGAERLPKQLNGKLPEEIRTSKSKLEALMRTTYLYALQGESWAVQFIAERTEGTVKDTLAVEQAPPQITIRLPTPEELEARRGSNGSPGPT